MKHIRYRLVNYQERKIFCNLKKEDISEIEYLTINSKKINDGKTRAGKLIDNRNNYIYAFTNEKAYIQSTKKFNTILHALLSSIDYINEAVKDEVKSHNQAINRLLHNLITLNAQNVQELDVIFPQEDISRKINNKQITYIEKIVSSKSKEVSLFLLKQAKNNTSMKAEFSVFQMLYDDNTRLQISSHNVHRVIMNILYTFFPDFTDKNVNVVLTDSTYKARFDYKSFHVVLYHLLDNATKYIKPKSKFLIHINKLNKSVSVEMEMISLIIKDDEKKIIFEEGYSGYEPKKIGRNGQGIGLSIVKKILELNHGRIEIFTDKNSTEDLMGCEYQKNKFIIYLPIK